MISVSRRIPFCLFLALLSHSVAGDKSANDFKFCESIRFKGDAEPGGRNCSEAGLFPVLDNCTAYVKCDYVPSLGKAYPEEVHECGPGQVFDWKAKNGTCVPGNPADPCDQTECGPYVPDSALRGVGGRSGKYVNQGGQGQGQGRSDGPNDEQEDKPSPAVPLTPPKPTGKKGEEGQGVSAGKEDKAHNGHNGGGQMSVARFLPLFIVPMLLNP